MSRAKPKRKTPQTPAPPAPPQPPLPAWKKLLFSLLTVVGFFALLEGGLALWGVKPELYEQDPYVGFARGAPLFVEEEGADGETYLATARNKISWFNEQRFLKDKPPGAYRIFSLGGSTTYGRPYTDKASFSAWLRELLPVADPSRAWEVVNAGGVSYASYRVAALMEELAGYEPDLFLICTGHNEFLERRSYEGLIETPRVLTEAGALLSRTRIYTFGRRLLSRPKAKPARTTAALLPEEVDAILDHSLGPRDYTRDDPLRERIEAHYRFNLHRMIDIARAAGAEAVLITPAANLKDCSPFKSEAGAELSGEARERFDELLAKGRSALENGRSAQALESFDAALAVDGRYAEAHYRRGQALYELGRNEQAKAAFERALDEDVCPLRILSSMERIVVETAAEKGVPLVDFARLVADRSAHSIPGAEFFLDHVHLNVRGYRLLALDIIATLARQGVVEFSPEWGEDAVEAATRRVEGRIDRQAEGVALRNLAKVFDWAGKYDEARRLAVQATELLGADAESYKVQGHSARGRGEIDEAIRFYRKALEIQPDYVEPLYSLGAALLEKGRLAEAIAEFRRVLDHDPRHVAARINLGSALLSRSKVEEAANSFREALRIEPNNPEPAYNLGLALQASGHLPDAIESYRRALRLKPAHAAARSNLGVALAQSGDSSGAAAEFRRAIDVEPRNPESHDNLGRALATQGRLEEAVEYFQRAVELSPEFAKARYSLGLALAELGRAEQALEHLREAARLAPDAPGAWTQIAWILSTTRDARLRSAAEAVRAARLSEERDPSVLDALAAAYAEAGRFEEAAREAGKALRLYQGAGAADLAAEAARRVEIYRARRPYREAPRG